MKDDPDHKADPTPPEDPDSNPNPGDGDDDSGETWDHERGMATIRKLRAEVKEAQRTAAELKPLADRAKEFERQQLSEVDRLKAEKEEVEKKAAEAERRLRDASLRHEIQITAQRLGFVDDDIIFSLVDPSQVEWDGEGKPQGISDILKKAASDKKFLLKADDPKPRTPVPGSPRPSASTPAENQQEVRRQHVETGRYGL